MPEMVCVKLQLILVAEVPGHGAIQRRGVCQPIFQGQTGRAANNGTHSKIMRVPGWVSRAAGGHPWLKGEKQDMNNTGNAVLNLGFDDLNMAPPTVLFTLESIKESHQPPRMQRTQLRRRLPGKKRFFATMRAAASSQIPGIHVDGFPNQIFGSGSFSSGQTASAFSMKDTQIGNAIPAAAPA